MGDSCDSGGIGTGHSLNDVGLNGSILVVKNVFDVILRLQVLGSFCVHFVVVEPTEPAL